MGIRTCILMTGKLYIPTEQLCADATMTDSSRPTLFWKLVPASEYLSTYAGNDILKMSVDKTVLNCQQGQSISFPIGA